MKFYESLFILTRTYDNITYLSEIMWDHDLIEKAGFELEEKKVFHYLSLFSHIILETCSFLEEYEKNLFSVSEDQYKNRIRQLRKNAQPVIDKINEWKGLRDYRNQMIAHPWRIRQTKEFAYKDLFSYDIPTGYLELQLLRQYLRAVVLLIEVEFAAELEEMPRYITSIPHAPRRKKIVQDWFLDMHHVMEQVNLNLEESRKGYRLEASDFTGLLEEEYSKLKNL